MIGDGSELTTIEGGQQRQDVPIKLPSYSKRILCADDGIVGVTSGDGYCDVEFGDVAGDPFCGCGGGRVELFVGRERMAEGGSGHGRVRRLFV